jgi:hypothetical protein
MATDRCLIRTYGLGGFGGYIEDWLLLDKDVYLPLIVR